MTDRSGSWLGQVRGTANHYVNPVVVGQVMTYNDSRPSVFWSRGAAATEPASSTAVRVGKHVGENRLTSREAESRGYVAAESSTVKLENLLVQAALGADTVIGLSGGNTQYPITHAGSGTVALLGQSGMDGGDGSWAVLHGANAATGPNLVLAVDEDSIGDSERAHGTEQVAHLAISPRPVCPVTGCDPAVCVPGYLGEGAISSQARPR